MDESTTKREDAQGEPLAKTRVLIVEDDIFLRDLLAQRLNKENLHLIHATDGESAVTLALSEDPDIILLDINLPGMNGFEALEKIKEDAKASLTPVIFLSNFGHQEYIDKGRELGAVDFLVKADNSLDQIVDRIKSVLSSHLNT
jgi:DNA-binding response OmpR family regulator